MRTAIISLMSFGLAWIVPQIHSQFSPTQTDAESVQEFLNLSADQQKKLDELSKSLRQKAGESMKELESKQKALRMQLANDDNDPLGAGKALLELEVAKRKSEQTSAELRTQALSILTTDQREKLKVLEQAQKLHGLARQASGMFLIAPPDAFLTGTGPLGMFSVKKPAPAARRSET